MLVGRLEIHVGWIAQFRMQGTDSLVRNAAVDPNIDRIVAFRRTSGETKCFGKIRVVQFKPNV